MPGSLPRWPARPVQFALPLVAVFLACSLAVTASRTTSVTVDEFGYLPHGLAWLDPHAAKLEDGNPPLFKRLGAVVLRAGSYKWQSVWPEQAGDFWTLGTTFMGANRANYQSLYETARLAPIAALAVTCLLTFALATRLYGPTAGSFAALLTALDPNLLAHGGLLTPDIFFTAATLATVLLAVTFYERPSLARACAVGLSIGLACLFKVAGLLLAVLLLGTAFAQDKPVKAGSGAPLPWSASRYRVLAVIGIVVAIHLGYFFEGSWATFGELTLRHPVLRWLSVHTPWLPTVVPADFLRTIDFQLADGGYPAYLDGRLNTTGFFDYYVRGVLYKTPPVVLVLVVAAAFAGGRPKRAEAPMLLVAAGMFAAFSLLRSKNIGIRYVLFLYPLMHVWIGRLVATAPAFAGRFKGRVAVAVCVCALAAAATSEARIFPNHLAYFNVIAGGPSKGPLHLLDSNVDWGQDLVRLKRFMKERNIASVDLAYFGRVDPEVYGISYQPLAEASHTRWAAVSANFIYGRGYFMNGSRTWADVAHYRRFQARSPVTRLGYSLYVYDVGVDVSSTEGLSPP